MFYWETWFFKARQGKSNFLLYYLNIWRTIRWEWLWKTEIGIVQLFGWFEFFLEKIYLIEILQKINEKFFFGESSPQNLFLFLFIMHKVWMKKEDLINFEKDRRWKKNWTFCWKFFFVFNFFFTNFEKFMEKRIFPEEEGVSRF